MVSAAKTKSPARKPDALPGYRPPYKRIEADLRHKISCNVWAPGMILPSRREMALSYRVSLGTIERAISDLLEDGTLTSRDRRGTFVSEDVVQTKSASAHLGNLAPASRQTSFVRVLDPGKVATIGIVCPMKPIVNESEWEAGWPYVVISAVERYVTSYGMRTRFPDVHPGLLTSPIAVSDMVDELLDQGVDGLVFVMLAGSDIDDCARRFAPGRGNLPPAVFVLTEESNLPGASIYYDNFEAGLHAANHLLEQGCRSLTFVAPYESGFVERRLAGIKAAMSLAGLPESNLCVSVKPSPIENEYNAVDVKKGLSWIDQKIAGYHWSKSAFPHGFQTDGVIAINDETAFGMIRALRESDFEPGRDYALIGFDDAPVARTSGITTLRPPLELMGEEAGRLILDAVGGKRIGQRLCLHSHLIARQSSTRLSLDP
jgi:DNA-binding LacI/PurR family transcriptional regulator